MICIGPFLRLIFTGLSDYMNRNETAHAHVTIYPFTFS